MDKNKPQKTVACSSSPLSEVSSQAGKVIKNRKNDFLGYRYAELSQVLDAIGPTLEKLHMFVSFDTQYVTIGDQIKLVLVGTLYDQQNNPVCSSQVPLIGVEGATSNGKNSPMQNLGSALTYARRYCLLNMFNLVAEDDDGMQGFVPQQGKTTLHTTRSNVSQETYESDWQ